LNGAIYEGLAKRIGSIAVGKDADLIVVEGDLSRRVTDIENIEYVCKDGISTRDREKFLNFETPADRLQQVLR
jgi:imidazolonepropionase-like amidohydrolase